MISELTGIVSSVIEQPSETAMTAAAARAAHLIVDGPPPIFADTLAATMLGDRAGEFVDYHREHGDHPVLAGARAQAVCRSRFTEDVLAQRVSQGVGQYVILGAGLDSYAYRSNAAVQVFEVDHPATQAWKRGLLASAGITESATMVPVDFETDSLSEALVAHGFDVSQPAVVSWLGVTLYLTEAAIGSTLGVVGGFAPGTDIVVDYMLPAGLRDAAGDTYVELVAPMSAQRGEPWLTFLAPEQMSALLSEHGFGPAEHVDQRDVTDWTGRTDALRPNTLSMLANARVSATGR
jgi:methyltransferase (TIGR00027 family)